MQWISDLKILTAGDFTEGSVIIWQYFAPQILNVLTSYIDILQVFVCLFFIHLFDV